MTVLAEIFQERWLDIPSLAGGVVGACLDPFLLVATIAAASQTPRGRLFVAIASVALPPLLGLLGGLMDTIEPGNFQLDLYVPRFLAVWLIGSLALRFFSWRRERLVKKSREVQS